MMYCGHFSFWLNKQYECEGCYKIQYHQKIDFKHVKVVAVPAWRHVEIKDRMKEIKSFDSIKKLTKSQKLRQEYLLQWKNENDRFLKERSKRSKTIKTKKMNT